MSLYKKYAFRGLIAGAFIALVGVVGGFVTNNKPIIAQSARDCDSNAVLYCGAMTVDELIQKYNSTPDVAALYNYFGISAAKVNSLKTTVALGEVHKDGTVWLKDGTLLGSNALTAARVNFAGSTPVPGTNFFMRPPSVSFAHTSIDAFIGFENGKPAWAILSACGNPVTFDHPHTTITKQVGDPNSSGWVKDATYPNNSEIQYLLTLKNDGKATDTNVKVIDQLPANQTYVAGSTKINGAAGPDGVTSNGLSFATLAPGQIIYIQYHAKITLPTTKCGVTDMENIAREDSDKSGTTEDNAFTHTNVVCRTVSCSSLAGPDSVVLGGSGIYTATASDSSLVAAYAFTVNGHPVNGAGNKVSVTFSQAGTYTIAATITPIAGVTNGGSANCVKTVTVGQPKVVSCTSLTGPDDFTVGDSGVFTANVSDASLVSAYAFTVNGNHVNGAGNKVSVTFSQAGTYTIAATITPNAGVTNGGSAACVKTVTVKERPMVKCDSLTGPSTLNVGDTGIYTASASDSTLVSAYAFTVNGNHVNGAGNKVSVTFSQAGTYTIAATITPIAGVTDGGSADCVKTVTINERPHVITSCDALTADHDTITLGQTATLTAHETHDNTSVTKFEFSVDGSVVQSGASATFAYTPTTAGDHTVSVKVTFANGDVKDGENCVKKIHTTEIVTPVYSCDLLTLSTATIKDGDKVTATVKYTALNGATFQSAVVNFGEASVNVPTASNGSFTADYTYKTAKDYNVTATITFLVNGQTVTATSSNCAAKVSTKPVEMCKVPGKEQFPANDSRCATVLPNTGAGNMIGLFAAVTAAGAVLHNVWMRKFNR